MRGGARPRAGRVVLWGGRVHAGTVSSPPVPVPELLSVLPIVLALAQPAAEGETPPPADPAAVSSPGEGVERSPWERAPARPWTISLEPGLWYASPTGTIRLPGGEGGSGGGGGGSDAFTLDELGLDRPSLEPAGQVHLQGDRWRLTVGGFWLSAEQDGTIDTPGVLGSVPVGAGDRVETDLEVWNADVYGSYRLARYVDGTTDTGGDKFVFGFDVLAGARALGVEYDSVVESGGFEVGRAGVDETYLQPIVGARMEFRLYERIILDVAADAGYISTGGEELRTLNVRVGISIEPVENVGLQVGYRNLDIDLEDGDFEWDGGIAGFFWGVRVLF